MFEQLKRGEAARDVRLLAARGMAQAPPGELLSLLVWLTRDEDEEVRSTAAETLAQLPTEAIRELLGGIAAADEVRAYFEQRPPSPVAPASADENAADAPDVVAHGTPSRDSIIQKLARMTFPQRLQAASKGSREVRALLIRDPSKVIAMAVLTSPTLTAPEVETFARMGNVAEDVLRYIGSNRAWTKNYGIVLALTKNSKTPLGLSLNLMNRLNDRDLQSLSTDRNVPEPLRMAARRKATAPSSR